MFQYTTETIINSNVGRLASGKRFDVLDAQGASIIDWSGSTPALAAGKAATDAFMLLIDGVNSLRVANIDKVYRAVYRPSQNEVATFTFPSVTAKDVVRVAISLREEGSVRASMQDAYLHHRKPFFYEIVATGTPATDAAALVKLINKDMREKDEKFFKAEASGATVTLTALDCYIRFIVDKFSVASVPASNPATNMAGILLGFEDYDDLNVALTITTPGDQGQGTVARLVKNLRIPTNASINPFAADQGGKPVPGGHYDQFLLEYITDRHHVSGTVVGSINEKSLTSHVLFMHQDVAPDFATVLTLISKAPVAAGRGDATGTGAGSNVTVTAGVATLNSKAEMGSVE